MIENFLNWFLGKDLTIILMCSLTVFAVMAMLWVISKL